MRQEARQVGCITTKMFYNRVGQFVSVVLEYPVVVLERKDRWVSYVMVVIIVNDQGSVVVIAVVLQGKK